MAKWLTDLKLAQHALIASEERKEKLLQEKEKDSKNFLPSIESFLSSRKMENGDTNQKMYKVIQCKLTQSYSLMTKRLTTLLGIILLQLLSNFVPTLLFAFFNLRDLNALLEDIVSPSVWKWELKEGRHFGEQDDFWKGAYFRKSSHPFKYKEVIIDYHIYTLERKFYQ